MSNELESTESVVSTESPSEALSSPQESSVPESSPSKQASPQEKYVPYERFQEIIQQKNEFAKRLEEHEARTRALEERSNRPKEEPKPKAENPLLARLKGIDPEFATWAEQMEASRAEVESLRTYRMQAEAERTRSQAESELSRLHSEFKVPKDEQDYFKDLLQLRVQRIEASGRMLTIKDLEPIYKELHDSENKRFESRKRATIANYAASKKSDSTPSLSKGVAPKPAQTKVKYSADREEAKAQIIKQAIEQHRAAKNSGL